MCLSSIYNGTLGLIMLPLKLLIFILPLLESSPNPLQIISCTEVSLQLATWEEQTFKICMVKPQLSLILDALQISSMPNEYSLMKRLLILHFQCVTPFFHVYIVCNNRDVASWL